VGPDRRSRASARKTCTALGILTAVVIAASFGLAPVELTAFAGLAAEAATLAQGVVLRYDGDLAAMDRLCAGLSAECSCLAVAPESTLGGAVRPESELC